MKKTKKFAVGGYSPNPTGPSKPVGNIMGPKAQGTSGVMDGLKRMAVSPKPNMSGPITAQNGPRATPPPFKLPQGMNPNFKPGEGPKYTGPGFGPKGPAATPVGPKPQIMGGSRQRGNPTIMLPNPKNKVGISEEDMRIGALRTAAKDFENYKKGTPTIYETPTPVPPSLQPQPANKIPSKPMANYNKTAPQVAAEYKKGGAVKASKRGDGIAQRGKTKCRMV